MPKPKTTERHLGWPHQQQRRALMAALVEGTSCPCLELDDCGPGCPCRAAGHGLPMYTDAELNPDGMPLEADHTTSRSRGGRTADRLLLATCNRSRGAGTRRVFTEDRPSWRTRDWW